MRRRSFIRLSATALAFSLNPPWAARAQAPKRVLIIGGGAAGLSAADRLRQAGHRTILIEARKRLGGRVWTHNGLDLGASWIHGRRGNPLLDLVSKAKAPTFAFDYDNMERFDAAGELSEAASTRIDEQFSALQSRIAQAQKNARDNATLSSITGPAVAALSGAAQNSLRYAINTSIVHEYAADPDRLSLPWYDEAEEYAGGDLLLPGGYFKLLESLGQPDEVHLGQAVRKIEWSHASVKVITEEATYEGDAAIVTLPLGVLKAKKVDFSPALPAAHQAAIQRLGFGTLNKLFLQFPRIAWPTSPHLFGFVGQGKWEEWVNFALVNKKPVLLGFNAGSTAEGLEKMTDSQLVASAMEVLRTMFGSKLPDPVGVTASRWRSDPFALGSYSSYAPGSSPQDRKALAAPISPRLILAGEACSLSHPATVHGALLSGRQAAELIQPALR